MVADVLEVVHAIRNEKGITAEELQRVRTQKAAQKGCFADGIVLERVDPADSDSD